MKNISSIKNQFPIFDNKINNKDLIYLDSAASAQKPRVVLETLQKAYSETYSNVHRGLHWLSETSTEKYENVRIKAAKFLGANSSNEIIYGYGATYLINMVANTWGLANLKENDEIIISIADHHANIVPWQMVCQRTGSKIKAFNLNENDEPDLENLKSLISDKTKIIAVPHVSNVLGSVYPLEEISKIAKSANALFFVDGCQGAIHLPVNVSEIGCDFYVFSAHKLYSAGGVGILWGKKSILNEMPPFLGGGDMIDNVNIDVSTYAEPPYRFEAGTPPIAEIIALGEAISFVENIGMENIRNHEEKLLNYFHGLLDNFPGLKIYGNSNNKSGVISFTMENAHPHDIATILDQEGIAIRAGHHCAQPLMKYFNIPATARASLGIYSSKKDADELLKGLNKVKKLLK